MVIKYLLFYFNISLLTYIFNLLLPRYFLIFNTNHHSINPYSSKIYSSPTPNHSYLHPDEPYLIYTGGRDYMDAAPR